MGCIVCNMISWAVGNSTTMPEDTDETKRELCYDLVMHHPEMLKLIDGYRKRIK